MLYEIFVRAISLSKDEQKNYLFEIKQAHPELFDELLEMLKDDEASKEIGTQFWSSLMADESSGIINSVQDLTGLIINSFKLTELIDKGGMGSVYKAHRCDDQFEQTVAIKIIHSELENIIGEHALIREAGFMAKLTHPNIGKVFDAGVSDDGHHFIVMEYIDGCTIIDKFHEATLSLNEKLKIFCGLCDAVNHAHQMQVIHADLKPANILITQENQVKILDFGIARMFNSRSTDSSAAYTSYLNAMTASYASPELLAGEKPNMYSDIFALGKVFSSLFDGSMHNKTKYQRELNSIGNKASASNSTERYSSVVELRKDIEDYISGYPVSAFKSNKWYQFNKLVFKRHPIASLQVISIIIFVSFLLIKMTIQNKNLLEANEQSTLLVDKFSKLFELTDKYKTNGEDYTANVLLQNAVNILNQESDLTPDSTAKLKLALAKSNMSIGEYEQAKTLLLYIIDNEKETQDKDIIYTAANSLVRTFIYLAQYENIEPTLSHLVDQEYINGALDQRYSLAQLDFYIKYILGVYVDNSVKVMNTFKSQRKNTIEYIINHYSNELTDKQRAIYLYELGRTLYHDLPFFWVYTFEQTKDSVFEQKNAVDIGKAIKHLKESLEILQQNNDADQIVSVLSSLARNYIELDQYQLAAPLLIEIQSMFEKKTFNPTFLIREYKQLAYKYYYDKPLKSIIFSEKALKIARKQEQINASVLLDLALEIVFHYGNSGELSRQNKLTEEMAQYYLTIPKKERTFARIKTMTYILLERLDYLENVSSLTKKIVTTLVNDLEHIKSSNISPPYQDQLKSVEFDILGLQSLVSEKSYVQGRTKQLHRMIKQVSDNARWDSYNKKLKKVRLALILSHAGNNKSALNILTDLPEFPWNKKEVRQSAMRLSVLLMKGHVYINAKNIVKASALLKNAKEILSNIELNTNNAWQGKLLLLEGEISLIKGDIASASQSLQIAKLAIEKHFPANSVTARHLNELLNKINSNIH